MLSKFIIGLCKNCNTARNNKNYIIHKALILLQNDMLGMRNIYPADIDMCIVGTLEQFRF